MFARRLALTLLSGLLLAGPARDVQAAAEPPKIRKPQPAPDTPPDVPPLPPAFFDPNLAVGGEDVKARKVETRLTVQVLVNGSGPYNFIVDSGADTSVVGLRIARSLQLPLGTPAILNSMTARNIVDRVKVDHLTLGPTTVRDLQLPALRESDVGGDGMIGIDALVEQRLMMDFENRLIKVEDARIPWKRIPGEIVVVARRYRGQLILTEVQAAGLTLDAVIDTGTQITIGNLALARQADPPQPREVRDHSRDRSDRSDRRAAAGEDRGASARSGGPQRRADGLRRRAAVQDVRPVRPARACCSGPTSSNRSGGSRWISGRARSASSSGAASPRESSSPPRRKP